MRLSSNLPLSLILGTNVSDMYLQSFLPSYPTLQDYFNLLDTYVYGNLEVVYVDSFYKDHLHINKYIRSFFKKNSVEYKITSKTYNSFNCKYVFKLICDFDFEKSEAINKEKSLKFHNNLKTIENKLKQLRQSAYERGFDFNLKHKDVEVLLSATHCQITGVLFDEKCNIRTIDRIDSNKGYVKGNVIAVTYFANCFKNEVFEKHPKARKKDIDAVIAFYYREVGKDRILV